MERHPPRYVQFTNGDFAKLKELILWRLDNADEERKELAKKIEALTQEVRANNNKLELAQNLLKIKLTGLSAISAIVSGAISASVTAYEFLKRWRP